MATTEFRRIEADKELAKALEQYVGQWVAISDHLVVDYAPSAGELLDRVDVGKIEGIFKVPTEKRAALL